MQSITIDVMSTTEMEALIEQRKSVTLSLIIGLVLIDQGVDLRSN
jgi:hypothetical protein